MQMESDSCVESWSAQTKLALVAGRLAVAAYCTLRQNHLEQSEWRRLHGTRAWQMTLLNSRGVVMLWLPYVCVGRSKQKGRMTKGERLGVRAEWCLGGLQRVNSCGGVLLV